MASEYGGTAASTQVERSSTKLYQQRDHSGPLLYCQVACACRAKSARTRRFDFIASQ